MIRIFFILISAHAHSSLFPAGKQYTYKFSNDVFIKDFKNGRPIAYRLTGVVKLANILTVDDEKLLKFTLESPQLQVRPHGSDSQTEFIFHKSPIDNYKNQEFYAVWSSGNLSHIYYDASENIAMTNVKKAIVDLFQFKDEGDYTENRASGRCDVRYRHTSPTAIRRMKENCVLANQAGHIVRPEKPLQANVQSYRSTDYEFFNSGAIEKIESRDYFHIALEVNRHIGGSVDSIIVLQSDVDVGEVSAVDSKSAKEFLSQLKNYKSESLETILLNVSAPVDSDIKKAIKDNEDGLATANIGTVPSAKAFLNILPVARVAQQADLIKLLESQDLAAIKVFNCSKALIISMKPILKSISFFFSFIATSARHIGCGQHIGSARSC